MKHSSPPGKLPPTAATVERAESNRNKHPQFTEHPAFRNDPRLRDDADKIGWRRLLSAPASVRDAHLRELCRQGRFGEAQLVERAAEHRLQTVRAFAAECCAQGGGA